MPAPFPSIFLSYARADDEPFVRRLCDDLIVAGFEVWFDRDDLRSRGLTFHHEIRNAIDACDRIVLIVGPRAAESEYVRQEWQYAWFDKAKGVTPILRKPRGSEPANDDYALIPAELRLLHCEDFRDDHRYDAQLPKLIASLEAPPPKLGQLIGVPGLPHRYLSRAEPLTELRDAVRAGLDGPAPLGGTTAHRKLSGIVGRQRMAGMAGMGGIGKSVLALLLAHDRFVREAFPDGIVWVALGSSPNLVELMRRVCRDLGGDGAFEDVHAGKKQLVELLERKSVLLILDDAWHKDHVEAFDVLGPTCRALITTRDAQLVTSLGGTPHLVELLSDDEALRLLAATLGTELDQLPPEAPRLIRECGRLPLAVALAGGMIAAGETWKNLLEAFEDHELDFFQDRQRNNQHHDLLRTIEVSVNALEPDQQTRLIELGVFPEDETIPEAAVACLWERTGRLSYRKASSLLIELKQRSLLRLSPPKDGPANAGRRVSLHDLIHDYCLLRAQQELRSESALHERLLDAYRARCSDGWSSGPNDGYFFERLVHHLIQVEDWAEAERTVTDFRWLMRKCELGLLDSVSDHFRELIEFAPREVGRRLQVWQTFFQEKAHILRRGLDDSSTHKILLQLALEHADDSPLTQAAEAWLGEDRCDWLRLQRVPRPERMTKSACATVLEGHRSFVIGARSLPDGRILSWSQDKTLRVWDVASGACLAVLEGHTDRVTNAKSLPDGRLLSWSDDKTLRVWDAANGACLAVLDTSHALSLPDGWRLSPSQDDDGMPLLDGRRLSWSQDTLRVSDVSTGACLAVLEGHSRQVNGALSLRDGRILSWSDDWTLRVWDAAKGTCLAVLKGHADPIWGALSLPDGRILSWSIDSTLRVWDVASGTGPAGPEGHADFVRGAISSPGGRITSWSDDKTVRVWDAESGVCLAVLEGHSGLPQGALSLPDGQVLSWSDDRTLRVWDVASGICRVVLAGHTGPIYRALSLPHGRILSWSEDDTLRVWSAADGACVAEFSKEKVERRHSEWLEALRAVFRPREVKFVDGFSAVIAARRSARLRHRDVASPLAHWHAESSAFVFCLQPDATVVVCQTNGQVCILKLFQGRRRISLTEAEELVSRDARPLLDDAR